MSWLFEDPTLVLAAGVMIEALLAVALVRTGRVALAGMMAGVLLLVLLLVLVEWWVVTDVEQVEATLDGAAAALEANDVEALLNTIDPDAAEMRSQVGSILGRVVIREVRIRDLKITLRQSRGSTSAEADFLGIVSLEEAVGGMPYENYIRRLTVYLRRRDGRWLMIGYEERR